jgi:hypothetical protein
VVQLKAHPEATYAIDRLGGGEVLVFIDPMAEMAARANPVGMSGMPQHRRGGEAAQSWGVATTPADRGRY